MFISKVSISPAEAAALVRSELDRGGDKIEEQMINADGKTIFLLSYEEYFMRTDSKIGITVLIEDIEGSTAVRAISAGGGRGALLKLGFGANGDYEKRVNKVLSAVSVGVPTSVVAALPVDGSARADVTAGWGGTWEIVAHADRIQLDHKKKNKTMLFPYQNIQEVSAKGETLTIKLNDGTSESIIFITDGACRNWHALIEGQM